MTDIVHVDVGICKRRKARRFYVNRVDAAGYSRYGVFSWCATNKGGQLGSQRECTRILGLDGRNGGRGTWSP
jgi:hypothetical protein